MDAESMDRLLRRGAQAPAESETAACLDSETIAAFIDDGLAPAQRAAAEAHIADCERCLQLTAAVVRTAPPALEAPRRSWLRVGWLAPVAATAVIAMAAWLMIRDPQLLPEPVFENAPAAARSDERAAPVLPSESSKATVPELRQEQPARSDAAVKRRPANQGSAGNLAAAERKAEVDAVTQRAPAAAPSPAPQPAPRPEDLARDGLTSLRQMTAAMKVVASPDPLIQWRFSEGALERTADGGRTWIPHEPGAAGFLAAAAPSTGVLWLAGRAGLVLLTTDGRTWQRVDLPDKSSDAVQVTAADGRSASVTTAAGATYRTSDAGRTWVLQESAADSF